MLKLVLLEKEKEKERKKKKSFAREVVITPKKK